MKKLFYSALAMVAVLFASCEKIEPTAVEPANFNSQAVVCGFVQYTHTTSSQTKKDILPNEEVTVLYGTTVNGKKTYTAYSAKTDTKGFYTISLPVPAGKAIEEVKVMCEVERTTEGTTDNGTKMTTNAIFNGENTCSPKAGTTTQCDLNLTVKVLLDKANLK